MAKLYVTEFPFAGGNPSNNAQVAIMPYDGSVVTNVVDYSGGVTQSPVFGANTRIVRLHTDAICSVLLGTNPTATTNALRMAANSTEYFGVVAGSNTRVSVISNT